MPSDPDIPPPSTSPSHSSTTVPGPPSSLKDTLPDTPKRGDDPPTLAVIPTSSPLPLLSPSAPTSKPPSAAPAKPKSSRARARSRSPSPPPPPPPPLTTIRLAVSLGGPENYEVDIATLAKSTGQRPPTPVPVKAPDTSDSELGEDPNKDSPKRKRKRKNLNSEYYDLADPFIDDSELAVDQRTYFAQTKQTGFYVSSGEVALLKDKTPRKPKSRRRPMDGAPASTSAAANASTQRQSTAQSASAADGSRNDPFTVADGDEPPEKRRRYVTIMEGNKKRKVVDVESYGPNVQDAFADLKAAIAQANWEVKGKFPVAVKPPLVQLAVQVIINDEYDDDFFNLMPTLFPYNKFTMLKLIKRNVYPEHVRILTLRQDVLLAELAELTVAGFQHARDEYTRAVQLWEKKKEKVKAEMEEIKLLEDAGSGMDVDGGTTRDPSAGASSTGGAGLCIKETAKDAHPRPNQRYRLTERMKQIVWKLVLLSNEICRLENEKNTFDGSTLQVSEQGLRKVLYQKIVGAFPEGWMSSGQISREVSAMKKKQEKANELQEDGS